MPNLLVLVVLFVFCSDSSIYVPFPRPLHGKVGKTAKDLMAAGALVTDDVVIGIIRDEIKKPECSKVERERREIAQTVQRCA